MMARSIGLALAIAGLVACAAITTVSRTPAAAPCASDWLPPRAMMFGKGYIGVEAPQIVATRHGTAYLGDNAYALAPTDSGFTPLAGWPRSERMAAGFLVRTDGEIAVIPGPPGVRAFIGVRATGHAGVAHVFWAGSADTSAGQWRHVNSLWYAQFDGVRWSQPELILADTTLLWRHQYTGVVVADDRVHLTTLVEGRNLVPDVLHVVRTVRSRSVARRLGFGALYTSLAVAPDGTLFLGTIDGDRHDRARVLVRRSADSGRSWSEPVLVYRSGLGTAYDPRLVAARDGALYAAWIVEARNAPGRAESVYVSVSSDRGATWRPLPGLFAIPQVRDLWAVVDENDRLQVSFHSDAGDGAVVSATLDGAKWSNRVTFGPTPLAAVLAVPWPDSVILAWPEWQLGGPERIPAIMVSRRKSCPGVPPKR